MEKISTDILIIGAGAAGIRAAAAAKGMDVLIISKGRPTYCGSTFSNISRGWGIQALVDDERTDAALELFYNDIISAGLSACCEKLVRILVEESGPRLRDLLSYGIVFRKGPDGDFVKAKGCFSNFNRAYLTENISNVRSIFSAQLNKRHVKILTGHVVDLIISDDECLGAWAFIENRMVMIQSKAVIITAGGGAGIFEHNLVDEFSIGDGYALAYRAGAELKNLEFIQFMLGLEINESRQFLPVHQIDAGLRLLDSSGDDLLGHEVSDQNQRAAAIEQRAKHAPFSCRDLSRQVDFAVAKARLAGEKVHVVYDGINNESYAVDHYAHAFNGGIVINEMAESTVRGLFAAGEAAAGPHGADRMGGCMMTATQVFGRIAGGNAAERARQMKNSKTSERIIKYDKPVTPLQIDRDTGVWISAIERKIKKTMQRFVSVMRDEAGLLESRKILVALENELEETLPGVSGFSEEISRVENMILTGKLVVDSAIRRKKSLGSHYRIDC